MAFAIAIAIAGCDAKTQEKTVPITQASPTLSSAAMSRLEEADKLDGKSDHVIGKCYVCSLGMDGSDKFAVQVDGYSFHLCSKSCQQDFEKSTEEIVLNTTVPKETKQD